MVHYLTLWYGTLHEIIRELAILRQKECQARLLLPIDVTTKREYNISDILKPPPHGALLPIINRWETTILMRIIGYKPIPEPRDITKLNKRSPNCTIIGIKKDSINPDGSENL